MELDEALRYLEDVISDGIDRLSEDQEDIADKVEEAWTMVQRKLKESNG